MIKKNLLAYLLLGIMLPVSISAMLRPLSYRAKVTLPHRTFIRGNSSGITKYPECSWSITCCQKGFIKRKPCALVLAAEARKKADQEKANRAKQHAKVTAFPATTITAHSRAPITTTPTPDNDNFVTGMFTGALVYSALHSPTRSSHEHISETPASTEPRGSSQSHEPSKSVYSSDSSDQYSDSSSWSSSNSYNNDSNGYSGSGSTNDDSGSWSD